MEMGDRRLRVNAGAGPIELKARSPIWKEREKMSRLAKALIAVGALSCFVCICYFADKADRARRETRLHNYNAKVIARFAADLGIASSAIKKVDPSSVNRQARLSLDKAKQHLVDAKAQNDSGANSFESLRSARDEIENAMKEIGQNADALSPHGF